MSFEDDQVLFIGQTLLSSHLNAVCKLFIFMFKNASSSLSNFSLHKTKWNDAFNLIVFVFRKITFGIPQN